MSEQPVEPGQVWRSNDGKREYRVVAFDSKWDDCTVHVERGGRTVRRKIFADYLRRDYTLAAPAVAHEPTQPPTHRRNQRWLSTITA